VILWLDAHLPPSICGWLSSQFHLEAAAIRDLGLRHAEDPDIFAAARAAGAVVMTKDADFVRLLAIHGPPPAVLWVTCGNTSNRELRRVLTVTLADALDLLKGGEALVEIRSAG
jgi:predicted nuclease of predicted toxin-antitoxin system